MGWEQSVAAAQFRILLRDGPTDKFVFKALPFPVPDGDTKDFHTGDTNLVAGSVKIYIAGEELDPDDVSIQLVEGTFSLQEAPTADKTLLVSYHYQWWNDEQLASFLTSGANTLGVETLEDESLSFLLRPPVLHFSSYFAYMSKAADTAEYLKVGVDGFDIDGARAFPNWKRMAENAWQAGQDGVKIYTDSTLGGTGSAFKMRSYAMPPYVPTS